MLLRRATFIALTVVVFTIVAIALSCWPESVVTKGEAAFHDLVTRSNRRTPPNPKCVFLAIDGDSMSLDEKTDLKSLLGIDNETTPEARALKLMSEQWPWRRSVYALILDRLVAAGARTVVFDLNFPTPSEDDEAFRAALERYADRVVIGSNFTTSPRDEQKVINTALTLPAAALIPQTEVPDHRVGFVNFWPDADGVIRRAQFHANFAQFLGARGDLGEANYSSLAAQALRKFGHPELVPADNASHAFRYTDGPGQGFPPRSLFEIFVPEYWERNFHSGADFKDALVVIGAAGNFHHDEHPTPFGPMAGPEIQLNVINALLHRELLPSLPWPAALAVWLVLATAAGACAIRCASPVRRVCYFGLGTAVWVGAQIPLFNHIGVVAPVAGPLAVAAITGLVSLVYDMIRSGAEQFRLNVQLVERKRAQELLEAANAELEGRVAARTVELTALLDEKTVLLKEVHHRVKNNLQVISSLLNLQSNYIEDPTALTFFTESCNRVRSMAIIHEKLYQSSDLARIDFQDYLQTLTSGLQASFRVPGVRMAVDVDSIMLGVDAAVPCGLIVNELVTNCFKYAFKDRGGEIQISMKRAADERLQLIVSDNGIGFPKGVDFRNTDSLGMQIVTTLTDQIEGSIEMRNGVGTTFTISFPATQPKPS